MRCYLNNHFLDNLWTTKDIQRNIDINKKTKTLEGGNTMRV